MYLRKRVLGELALAHDASRVMVQDVHMAVRSQARYCTTEQPAQKPQVQINNLHRTHANQR
jgi:hypothetical protein